MSVSRRQTRRAKPPQPPQPHVNAKVKEPSYDDTSELSGGLLLNLTLVGDGIVSSVYTLAIRVGSGGTLYPLQIDTGSSDTWIVSSSCASQPCTSYSGPKLDPTLGSDTGVSFEIQYLQGYASGPIRWANFILGPYTVSSQAFASAIIVENELLSLGFSGILGLSFPLNSKIAQAIPPTNGDTPDGAPIVSNLFGLGRYGPREHFLSILLERPGMSQVPSVLGVGHHPSEILSNITAHGNAWESALQFSRVSMYQAGTLFWAAPLTGLTAYVNGTAVDIPIGQSMVDTDSVYPIAVFDTGIPYIFGRVDIINAFYGAYGIGPGTDGQYYVPCSTPINMTISIDSQTFAIHPLDVTYVSKSVQNQEYCIGAVQASASLKNADFILGAAFLRNVYTVLSYNRYNSKELANLTLSEEDGAFALLSITNITRALDEFNTVRIQHRPLPDSSATPTPGMSTGGNGDSAGSHGLGKLWALIGIIVAFGLVVGAFVTRWCFRRRRTFRLAATSVRRSGDTADNEASAPISLVSLGPHKKSAKAGESTEEDTLRSRPWSEQYKPSNASLTSSTNTRVGEWTEPGEFADIITGGPTPHNNEDGDDRRPHENARSRTSRSRSRGPSIYGGSLSALPDPTMLVTDANLLTNIPTLDEITPEILSSSRYPTFPRHSSHLLPYHPPLAAAPIYETLTPPESESTHQQPSPPLSPSERALQPLSFPADRHAGGTSPLTPASTSRPFLDDSMP